jgi:hypothetical protein
MIGKPSTIELHHWPLHEIFRREKSVPPALLSISSINIQLDTTAILHQQYHIPYTSYQYH